MLCARKRWVWVLALSLLVGGCALLKKKEEHVHVPTRVVPRFVGEPAKTLDGTPPPGYNPIWFKGVRPMDSLTGTPVVQVSRIDPRPDSLGVHLQIMDSAGYYYTGAAGKKWDDVWCLVTDSIHGVRQDTIWRMSLKELTEKTTEPMALYIVMDYSGSIGDERADKIQEAVRVLVENKRDKDAYGLIRFDDRVVHDCRYTVDKSRLLQKLKMKGMGSYGYGTAINDAVLEAVNSMRRINEFRRKAIVVFSDGEDNASVKNQDTVIYEARLHRIPVCTIDFGDSTAPGFLERYARLTGGSYHHIYGTFEFNSVFQDIYQRLLHSYYLTFASRDVGLHRVSVKLCLPEDSSSGSGWCNNTPMTDEEWSLYTIAQQKPIEGKPRPAVPDELPRYTVYFDFNISKPRDDQQATIEEAMHFLQQYPALRAEIRGHTDFTGTDEFNQQLSTDRCEAVRTALIDAGIYYDRILVQAWGETVPVANNHTQKGRSRNRRVEITLLPPGANP